MNEFDNRLLEEGNSFKHSFAVLASNLSKVVAGVTALVAVLVTFTEVSFASLRAYEVTTTLAVLLISAYVIYFSLEEAGEKQGEESPEYAEALSRHSALTEKITPELIPELRDFVEKYALAEAEYRRRCELLRLGYSIKDFEAYKRGDTLSREAVRALRRVAKIKPIAISAGTLLSKERGRTKSELCDPSKEKHLKMLLQLIPTTLCMLVTVSIVLSTKEGLGTAEIFEGIMKLSTLPIVGIRGYLSGLTYSKETRVGWLDVRSRLLMAFLSSEEREH